MNGMRILKISAGVVVDVHEDSIPLQLATEPKSPVEARAHEHYDVRPLLGGAGDRSDAERVPVGQQPPRHRCCSERDREPLQQCSPIGRRGGEHEAGRFGTTPRLAHERSGDR